ncbi:2'-5' RNA ligase family protein [Sphingomonas sp. SUN039]|uniref:2'-5' RNA ligase family protein n=1 Tax=Sphingomonas sp. SUN039 TaxID=2937787 RepID=UPI00216472F0|nr:2'-5' RNA ligase family protein [Sphingomonas sp. SUN039]UVO53286.1 2'-5' RNA ligase family protein [Sphingomonas sp. SUN039]
MTALLGREDFAWADALRRAHFPPERNFLRAHVTLFHHLPPSVTRELCDLLKDETRAPAPAARLASVVSLGRGVAYRIDSPDLTAVRARIADRFAAVLTPQDSAGWRPHITVQNKVAADVARALLATLSAGFAPRPLSIGGLAVWRYRGGPWEPVGAWAFGTGHAIKPPC